MEENTIPYEGKRLDLEGVCQLLETPNFVRFTPSEKVHRLFSFAAKTMTMENPSKNDIRYASILEKYNTFLLYKRMFNEASQILDLAFSLIKRTKFETIPNDKERVEYYVVWSAVVRGKIQREMGPSKPLENYKEIVNDLESRKFDDDIKNKLPLIAQIYMEMGMCEGALSPFPSPIVSYIYISQTHITHSLHYITSLEKKTRSYLEKAVKIYKECGDEQGALHSQYKIAEWCIESFQANQQMVDATRGPGGEEFMKKLSTSFPPEIQEKFGDRPSGFVEMMEKMSKITLQDGFKMINECVEKYTRDLKERNVFINMKMTKAKFLLELQEYEEGYKLINNAIKDALIHYDVHQVYIFGMLIVKGDILVKMGPKYYLMAMKCFREQSRYFASVGRVGESEQAKLRMSQIQKLVDESEDEFKMKDEHILPFKTCSNPYCIKRERKPGEFKCCSKCRSTVYCSRKCQIKHWKKGGHKKECVKWEKKIDEDVLKKEDEKYSKATEENVQKMKEDEEEVKSIQKELNEKENKDEKNNK